MLTKLLFSLHLTLSLQREKMKKIKPNRKFGGPQRDKILRRLKKCSRKDVFRNQSLGLRRLFGSLSCVINFYGNTTFDTLTLFASVLLLLKKLLLISIFIICKVLDSLLKEEINGKRTQFFLMSGKEVYFRVN